MASLLTTGRRNTLHRLYRYIGPASSPHVLSYGKRHQREFSRHLSFYKSFEVRSRGLKANQCNGLHTQYFRDRNHHIYRYLSCHGWRLSTSWGRSGYGWQNLDNSSKDNNRKDDGASDWYNPYRKRQQNRAKMYEDLKKQIDADPFGMLFGWRNSKGCHPRPSSRNHNTDMGQCKEPSKTEGRQGVKGAVLNSEEVPANKAAGDGSGPSSHSSMPKPFVEQHVQIEEFEIDPITMRKVPKRQQDLLSSSPKENSSISNYSISIKEYKAPKAETATEPMPIRAANELPNKQDLASGMEEVTPKSAPTRHSWLVQEGFGVRNQQAETSQPSLRSKEQTKSRDAKTLKIQSALDRYLMAQGKPSEQNKADHSGLRYTGRENTTEDIDLLRASDVRASSGLKNRSRRDIAKEKQEMRVYLEDDFKTRASKLDTQFKEEVASRKAPDLITDFGAKPTKAIFDFNSNQTTLDHSYMQEIRKSRPEMAHDGTSGHVPSTQVVQKSCQREMESHRQNTADNIHQEEVNTQKAAMEAIEMRKDVDACFHEQPSPCSQEPGEGDMASNVHEFINRDRWYKQKAPHVAQSNQMLQEQSKDITLIREIRSIYEDEYGIINTGHRQPSEPAFKGDEQQPQAPKTAGQSHHELESTKQRPRPDPIVNLDNQSLGQPSTVTRPNTSDSHNKPFDSTNPQIQGHQGTKVSEALGNVQNLFNDIPHIQRLVQVLGTQNSRKHSAEANSVELLNGSKAYEQILMQNLKGAWDLFKIGTDLPIHTNSQNQKNASPTSSESTKDDSGSQPSLKAPVKESSGSLSSASYKILAYDSSSQRVFTAKTCSSTGPLYEKSLTVVEALSGLTNPARFLPHLASLHNAGYEIVSGGSNILVFKKLDEGKPAAGPSDEASQTMFEHHPMHTNPIDGTTTQTGNFASPTGFVNHDSILPPSEPEDGQPAPSYPWRSNATDKIRREEPVFSGSRKSWRDHLTDGKSAGSKFKIRQRRIARRRRTVKRMFLVGTFVAGCCYAVGVVSEALRS